MIRRRRRAFVLITALLLSVILLVSGLGVMSAQASRYAASALIADSLQAKNAALSGMEDVRVKLAKDVKFPPRKSKSRGQTKFAYSENLDESDPARPVSYAVVVDFEYEREAIVQGQFAPFRWGVYRITVNGYVGPRNEPIALCQLYAEYDISTGQFLRFEDRSAL
jgi:hypothetical protein